MQAKYGMELELMCVEKVCILMNYHFLFKLVFFVLLFIITCIYVYVKNNIL